MTVVRSLSFRYATPSADLPLAARPAVAVKPERCTPSVCGGWRSRHGRLRYSRTLCSFAHSRSARTRLVDRVSGRGQSGQSDTSDEGADRALLIPGCPVNGGPRGHVGSPTSYQKADWWSHSRWLALLDSQRLTLVGRTGLRRGPTVDDTSSQAQVSIHYTRSGSQRDLRHRLAA
jgi:hypothetical protein